MPAAPQYSMPHNRNGQNAMTPQVFSGFYQPDYLYGVHVTLNAGCLAFKWNSLTDTYQTIDLATVSGNHFDLPLFDPEDDHYGMVIGVAKNTATGKDMPFIAGNHHENLGSPTTTHFLQCNNVDAFTNPASWAPASTAAWDALDEIPGASVKPYTYHFFDRMTDGTLLYFFSQSDTNPDTRGRDMLAFKWTGTTWVPLVGDGQLITTRSTFEGNPQDQSEANRCYIIALEIDSTRLANLTGDRVWIAGIWRTNDADATSQQKPFVAYTDDLTNWFGADGTPAPIPITWFNRASVEIPTTVAPATSPGVFNSLYLSPVLRQPAIIVRNAGTGLNVRLTYGGGGWASTAATPLGGQTREFNIDGGRWQRHNSTNQVSLRRQVNPLVCNLGGQIKTTGENFSPNWCPVWLRERNLLAVNIGDGNTPKIYTFGKGPLLYP